MHGGGIFGHAGYEALKFLGNPRK